MAGSSYWRPSSSNGKAQFYADHNLGENVAIIDVNTGSTIDTASVSQDASGRYVYSFSSPGNQYSDFVVCSADGEYVYISDGNSNVDNLEFRVNTSRNSDDVVNNGGGQFDRLGFSTTNTGVVSPSGQSNVAGISGIGNVATPEYLDSSKYTISDTTLEYTDPVEVLRTLAAENNGQLDANYLKSLEKAGELSEANTKQLTDYLDIMSPYQQQLIGIENAFNQQQQLQAAETAIPGITDTLRGEIDNAKTLASGKLLTTAEDLALEQTARSAGADAAWTRGLGDDSLVGQTLSNQLSVSQRLNLMEKGQNYLNTVTRLATETLMDTPQKASLASKISATPAANISDIATQQQSILNQYTTMSPESALNSIISQNQTQAQLDYNTKKTNSETLASVDSANIKAQNDFNQNVINDTNQTNAARQQSQAYNWAMWLYNNDKIDQTEYDSIKEQIASTGTFNPYIYDDKFSDHYNERTSSIARGDTPASTTTATPENAQNVSSSKSTTDTVVDTTSPIIYKSDTASTYNNAKVVQTDGTVTLPTYNTKYSSNVSKQYLQIIDDLSTDDFKGLV